MQLALNVNTALMALMRANVFCTEPFRVPLAGKISACLFDKTGTLTTDQLEAVGVSRGEVSAAQRALVATGAGEDESSRTVRPPPMLSASAEATRVETASLAPGEEMAPAVAEDLWSEPPDVRAWGEEGSALLDSGGEAAARALTLVALARDVFEQERRLVDLRRKVLERGGAVDKSPFEVRWKSEEELAAQDATVA